MARLKSAQCNLLNYNGGYNHASRTTTIWNLLILFYIFKTTEKIQTLWIKYTLHVPEQLA